MHLSSLVAALILFVIGVGFLLAGYRLFRALAPVWGFLIGFDLAIAVERAAFGLHPLAFRGGASLVALLLAVGVGLLAAGLAYAYYFASVVALGALGGFAVGEAVAAATLPHAGPMLLLAGLLGAIIAAALVIALDLPKALIVFFTALGGAYSIMLAALLVMGGVSLASVETNPSPASLVASRGLDAITVILMLVGILYQAWQLRRTPYSHPYARRRAVATASSATASSAPAPREQRPPLTV